MGLKDGPASLNVDDNVKPDVSIERRRCPSIDTPVMWKVVGWVCERFRQSNGGKTVGG